MAGTADFAKEAAELVGKVQRAGVTGLVKLKARLLTIRILRSDNVGDNAKKAEEGLAELMVLAEAESTQSEEGMEFYIQCQLESGHLYMQHAM